MNVMNKAGLACRCTTYHKWLCICIHNHLQDVFMSILIVLLYPLQDGNTPLHFAVLEDHTTCVEHLLSTSDIDINIKNEVSWCNECHE